VKPFLEFVRKILSSVLMVIAVAHLRFPSVRSIREGEKGVSNQALPLVPYKHAWAPFLSNVVLVGAYWWSFFTFNMVPERPVVVEQAPKPVLSDPVVAVAREPPDKPKQPALLTSDELQYCFEVLSVLLLLAREGYVFVPTWLLLMLAVLLLCYAVHQDAWVRRRTVTALRWTGSQLISVILWALKLVAEAWFWFFYTVAVVEAFVVRPYIMSWIADIKQAYWTIVLFGVETWLVLESAILLLLAPMLSSFWVPVVLLVHFIKLALKFCRPESRKDSADLRAEGIARSAKDQRKSKQRAHRVAKKRLRLQKKRLAMVFLALARMPEVMATPSEMALAATVSEFYDEELGCVLVENLPPEKLLAFRSQLQDFSNDIAMLDVVKEVDAFPVVVDSGASAWSTHCKDDFVPGTYVELTDRCMKGIAKSLPIIGKGMVRYEVVADDGSYVPIQQWCYHIPELPIRLASPQVSLRSAADSKLYEYTMQADTPLFKLTDGHTISIPYNATSKLPVLYASYDLSKSSAVLEASLTMQLESETNQNLSATQKEMLVWHHKLSHLGYSHIRWLTNRGLLGNKAMRLASAADKDLPLCATCLYG
jgi:hypothetical protein